MPAARDALASPYAPPALLRSGTRGGNSHSRPGRRVQVGRRHGDRCQRRVSGRGARECSSLLHRRHRVPIRAAVGHARPQSARRTPPGARPRELDGGQLRDRGSRPSQSTATPDRPDRTVLRQPGVVRDDREVDLRDHPCTRRLSDLPRVRLEAHVGCRRRRLDSVHRFPAVLRLGQLDDCLHRHCLDGSGVGVGNPLRPR